MSSVRLFEAGIGEDRLLLIGFAVALTAALWWVYRFTRFGLATAAVAENRTALATLGWSAERVAAANWAVGGALAALAGTFLAPITGLSVGSATLLLVPGLAAALIGDLRSFPLTLLGGIAIGVIQAELARYVNVTSLGDAVPLAAIVAVVMVRGRNLPLRSFASERLPRVTDGRINWTLLLASAAIVVVAVWFALSTEWISAVSVTLAGVVLLQSLTVVTGYAGQISLVQWPLAGVGGLVMARLVVAGLPFEAAIPLGVLACVPIGVLIGLPSLRARGISLAIVTLAVGVCIISLVLSQTSLTGGPAGLQTGYIRLFGLDVDPIQYPKRFAMVTLIAPIIVGLMLANLRRGPAGRRLLAVRANERAAAALGINIGAAKLIAFAYGAAIAGLAGILFVTQFPVALFTIFDAFTSVPLVSSAVIGGVGYVSGPVFGGIGQSGGILSQILSTISLGAVEYGPVILAGVTLLVLLQAQDGLVPLQARDARRVVRWITRGRFGARNVRSPTRLDRSAAREVNHRQSLNLEVKDVTVQLGGIVAVNHVAFRLAAGEVMGVIGPNGAGKTTLIDALSGFVPLRHGEIRVDGRDVAAWSVRRRARAGISRSFQSLELFEDMTVAENLLAACDPGDIWPWVRDLVRPGPKRFTASAAFAAREFGLEELLDAFPSELTYGTRRLLAIVRAIASSPRVLLLDEPAAGLDEQERDELAVLIRRLADDWQMAILLVDHDVALVANASDHMLALDAGTVIARGAPDDVRSSPPVVESYLGAGSAGLQALDS